MRAVLLAVLVFTACTTPVRRVPEPPRIRCLNLGAVPRSEWFVYVCTFHGEDADTIPPPTLDGVLAG